ncbi:MAG: hypothetical protein MI919_17420 [Holophagales bacterium]|nr:hypothetical protein [Holophagales bacterium]
MSKNLSKPRKKCFFSQFLLLTLLLAAGASTASTPDCVAPRLETGATLRGHVGEGESRVLRLEVPAAGLARLDAITPAVEGNTVNLDWLPSCTGSLSGETATGDAVLVEQSASHLVLATRGAGTLWLRVSARHVGRYKLITGFREAVVRDDVFDAESPESGRLRLSRTTFHATGTALQSEPERVDPDPDTLLARPDAPLLDLLRLSRPVRQQKSEPERVDPDPDTLTAGPDLGVAVQVVGYRGFCDAATLSDDHSDTAACATRLLLDHSVSGTIDNSWDDDVDVFAVTLNDVTTFGVDLGEADLEAWLGDCRGRRLAADGGDADGRQSWTLGPGRYCLRVEGGDGASGEYRLTATTR